MQKVHKKLLDQALAMEGPSVLSLIRRLAMEEVPSNTRKNITKPYV